jgi:hypothetical protein
MLLVFALTLFLSATLLFLVELMVGKMMLPLLGGTPAVWSTCMVFFQAVLLAGYGFAHASIRRFGPRRQARFQLPLLVLPLLLFLLNARIAAGPLAPSRLLILGHEGNPIPALLMVLTLCVGLPMFVVCTTAPLLQRWFSSTDHPAARDPYFLYGASNLGSMLALLGYPVFVEPFLTLWGQQVIWTVGYALLAVLVGVCAVLMWKSRHAAEHALAPAEGSNPTARPEGPSTGSTAIRAPEKKTTRHRGKEAIKPAAAPTAEPARVTEPITWSRRLRWIILAVVPSSLMLGVTTYITTDLAAIPLLWVLPLALYLLTFIIVFAQTSVRNVNILVFTGICLTCIIAAFGLTHAFESETLHLLFWLLGLGCMAFGIKVFWYDDPHLLHRVMIMAMPLLVLLLLFLMLSDTKFPELKASVPESLRSLGLPAEIKFPSLFLTISLHLLILFVVSMVCHGELAADRPAPKNLTAFFLWMSAGGVLGGLFNGLVAPVAFNAIIEYQLMMVVACLLLPPLGSGRESRWARWVDIALGGVILAIGAVLLLVRYYDTNTYRPDLEPLRAVAGRWIPVAFVLAVAVWLPTVWRRFKQPAEPDGEVVQDYRLSVVLDLFMPLCLLVLCLGLAWGLYARPVYGRLAGIATWMTTKNMAIEPEHLIKVLTFGLPAILCYTFVERWVRFGLGVGAILLAASCTSVIRDAPLYQDRSFFGVLKVESSPLYHPSSEYREFSFHVHRLVHGTTLHGKQFLEPEVRNTALSYYHATGPVGQVFRTYNTDPRRAYAVIGLGTGTMGSYALPGQRVDFYDIDPVVVSISYDTDEFFHFVEDAEDRGASVGLVLGDARLTFEPRGERPRLKPLRRRKGQPKPARQYHANLTPEDKYRLIVVDAFSSDAIPVHLITRQALEIYLQRMAEDAILCIHISNRYLDLHPVLANIAVELGLEGYHMSDDDNAAPGKNRSHWVMLARKKEYLKQLLDVPRWKVDGDQLALLGVALWPSASPGMNAACGMAHALQAMCEVQSQRLAVESRREEDARFAVTDWEPVETTPYLEQLAEQNEPIIRKYKEVLESVDKVLDELEKPVSDAEQPIKKIEEQLAPINDQLREIDESLKLVSGNDRTKLLRERSELTKKKDALVAKLEPLVKERDALKVRKDWHERIKKRLEGRIKRLQGQSNAAPRKIATNNKVGVWTDDYSNLWSVFTW